MTKGDNSDIDRLPVPASAVRGVLVRNLGILGKPFMLLTNSRILLMVGLPILAFLLVLALASRSQTLNGSSTVDKGAGVAPTGLRNDATFGEDVAAAGARNELMDKLKAVSQQLDLVLGDAGPAGTCEPPPPTGRNNEAPIEVPGFDRPAVLR